jgi:hypothetical protein
MSRSAFLRIAGQHCFMFAVGPRALRGDRGPEPSGGAPVSGHSGKMGKRHPELAWTKNSKRSACDSVSSQRLQFGAMRNVSWEYVRVPCNPRSLNTGNQRCPSA